MKEVLGRFSLAFSPFVEVRLEKSLVEFSHRSESSSSIEEIELFIVFLVQLVCLTGHFFT